MATITETDVLADNTTVRYEGSIEDFRGLYGWVVASYPFASHIRYDVALNLGNNRGIERLSLVRRTSLVPGDNPG